VIERRRSETEKAGRPIDRIALAFEAGRDGLIRDGLLPARQICAGAPYVIREEDLDGPAVQSAIASGRAVSPDPRQQTLPFQSDGEVAHHVTGPVGPTTTR
jgi:hypothetical protein